MPRVVMKGGILPAVVTRPFTVPSAVPTAAPASAASGTGTPWASRSAVQRPLSASRDPTDRSMPPEMITKVSPMPRMALMDDCWVTFRRLSALRKCGEATPSSTTSAASTSSAWARLPQSALQRSSRVVELSASLAVCMAGTSRVPPPLGLPVELRREIPGDQLLVVGPHLGHRDLRAALRVAIVSVELAHPLHRLVIPGGHEVLVGAFPVAGIKRVVAKHAQG